MLASWLGTVCELQQHCKSLSNCNNTSNAQNGATLALNWIANVHMRCRIFAKNWRKWNASKRLSHFYCRFVDFVYTFNGRIIDATQFFRKICASLFHCIICGIGLVLMYFICPDTNTSTLEDIERHFANNSKKITDWKITKSVNLWKSSNLEGTEMAKDRSGQKEVEKGKIIHRRKI